MISNEEYRRLRHERDELARATVAALLNRETTRAIELAHAMNAVDQKLGRDRITQDTQQ